MNGRQAILEIRRRMRALVFDGGAVKVFGSAGTQFEIGQESLRFEQPRAMGDEDYAVGAVWLGAEIGDDEDAELVTQEIHIGIRVVHTEDETNDSHVELPRVGWRTASAEAGIHQVIGEISSDLKRLGPDTAFDAQIQIVSMGVTIPALRGAYREIKLRAIVTRAKGYPPCRYLTVTDAGSGNASLAWALPPGSRYDRNGLVIEYAAGATAPADVGDGTDAAVGDTSTSLTVATGTGEYSFSIWAEYDDDWPLEGTTDSYSIARTGTITVT